MRQAGAIWIALIVVVPLVLLIYYAASRAVRTHEQAFPLYSTYSPQPAGALACYELLEAAGYKPQRYFDNAYHWPPRSCMLLLQDSSDVSLASLLGHDAKALRLWIEDGGVLLLASDPPHQQLDNLLDELQLAEAQSALHPPLAQAQYDRSGGTGRIAALSTVYKPGDVYTLPRARARLLQEVDEIECSGRVPAHYSLGNDTAALGLETLVSVAGSSAYAASEPLLVFAAAGQGAIIWLTQPEMLTNSWISRSDNAQFALAAVELATRHARPQAGGRRLPLYINEHAHGYAKDKGNALALAFQTPGGQLLLLAGLAVALLFAGQAVRPARFYPPPPPPRRTGSEAVLAQADLYRRAGAQFVLAESLIDGLRRAYAQARHTAAQPSDDALLQWLDGEISVRERRTAGSRLAEGQALRMFLDKKLLQPDRRSLALLARDCDAARGWLSGA